MLKRMIFVLSMVVFSGLAWEAPSNAQVGDALGNLRDCDTWLNWNYNAEWNRGNLPFTTGYRTEPRFTWFCQSKGTGLPETSYRYHFYDLSQGIAYDHSLFRCERDYQRCEVRCALVPISCIPYNP